MTMVNDKKKEEEEEQEEYEDEDEDEDEEGGGEEDKLVRLLPLSGHVTGKGAMTAPHGTGEGKEGG